MPHCDWPPDEKGPALGETFPDKWSKWVHPAPAGPPGLLPLKGARATAIMEIAMRKTCAAMIHDRNIYNIMLPVLSKDLMAGTTGNGKPNRATHTRIRNNDCERIFPHPA